MFGQLTAPLAVALFLSYVALAMVVSITTVLPRIGIARARLLLWVALGVGGTSVAIRTVYFAVV